MALKTKTTEKVRKSGVNSSISKLLGKNLVVENQYASELGNNERVKTGYPSKDRPWLKFYHEDASKIVVPNVSMYEFMVECTGDRLDDTAITYFNYTLTYGQLIEKADHIAAGFANLGVKAGDVVTLAIPNIPENVIAMYALNKIGAIGNLIDLRLTGDELIRYFNEVHSKVVVVCDLFLKNTLEVLEKTDAETVIVASPYAHFPAPLQFLLKKKEGIKVPKNKKGLITWEEFDGRTYADVETYHPDDVMEKTACILHTSGTTGPSKGVMLSNRSFNILPMEYRYLYGVGHFKPNTKIMNQVPPFLAYNIILCTHNPLCNHLNLDLLPNYEPDKFAENILKHKPQHVTAGPADWENFLNNPKLKGKKFDFLVTIASGSDSLRYETRKEVDGILADHGATVPIIEGYGMTEVGCAAATNHYGVDVPGSVGCPYPMLNFCIYDNDAGKELQYNQKGEICITGPGLMNGYYENPEATKEVMKVHEDGILWMHTGDLGSMNEDGFIFLDGRLKRILIQHNGMKVNPFEIEEATLTVPEVHSCCVVGAPDVEHGRGQVPAVYYVMNAGVDATEAEVTYKIAEACKEELNERYQPKLIKCIEALPITPNGKVDYRALEARSADDI